MDNKFLQTLFDNQIVGMVEVDATFQYRNANPHWLDMIGYGLDELRNNNIKSITHPEDLTRQLLLNQQLLNKQNTSYRIDKRYIRKDGTTFWAEVSVTGLYDDDNLTGMVALIIDISKRKATEIHLRESENRFRSLIDRLEHIPVQGYDEDRRVIYWNKASSEIYGYSQTEAIGQKLEDLIIPPHMREEVINLTQRWTNENIPIPSSELTLHDKNGAPVPVYSSHFTHTASSGEKELFCIDIDMRMLQQTEDQVRRLVAAIEQSGETIVITDTKGTIEYVNQAFTDVTGYSREEAIGKNPRILNSGQQDKSVYAEVWGAITKGQPWQGRFINRKKDGSHFTEDVTISPILDTAGKIVNFVAAKRDITEQLQVQEKYQQTQKMEAIGQLAGGVAHDFNNMLAIILGQVEVAMLKMDPNDPMRKRLNEINVAAKRSADLTRHLLGFARKQTHNPEVLNLNETTDSTLTMLNRLIGEQIELKWLPEAGLPVVKIDPGHCNQILTNLIINARDAIIGSGTITVRTKRVTLSQEFCYDHPGCFPGEYVRLAVTDTGCGISSEIIGKIFDPFFTTKDIGEGTGLGLSMVFGLIKQNHGYIIVNSVPNQNTTFKLYFPIHKEPELIQELTEDRTIICGDETILIVEDEISLLDVTKAIISEAGYTILSSDNPLDAIELVRDYDKKIDLLLTDVVMPQMNGPELSNNLRALKPQLKTLFISGYPQNNLQSQNVIVNFLPKPFSANILTQKVRDVLDQ